MKVSFVSNIDKKINMHDANANANAIPNSRKISNQNANKKLDNYSTYTNRANTVY